MIYLLQPGDYLRKEKAAVRHSDGESIAISFDELSTHALTTMSKPNNFVPVGTVEYTEKYCQVANIVLPDNISYPQELRKYLHRIIWQDLFKNVLPTQFVKPIKTKVFTGGIKQHLTELVQEHDTVWVSEPIDFTCEFRYYVIDGAVAGHSQYDDSDDAVVPDIDIVCSMIADYRSAPVAYAIDVGVSHGRTVLIEVNDGWALGLYPWGTMTNQRYVELITRRWKEITGATL